MTLLLQVGRIFQVLRLTHRQSFALSQVDVLVRIHLHYPELVESGGKDVGQDGADQETEGADSHHRHGTVQVVAYSDAEKVQTLFQVVLEEVAVELGEESVEEGDEGSGLGGDGGEGGVTRGDLGAVGGRVGLVEGEGLLEGEEGLAVGLVEVIDSVVVVVQTGVLGGAG